MDYYREGAGLNLEFNVAENRPINERIRPQNDGEQFGEQVGAPLNQDRQIDEEDDAHSINDEPLSEDEEENAHHNDYERMRERVPLPNQDQLSDDEGNHPPDGDEEQVRDPPMIVPIMTDEEIVQEMKQIYKDTGGSLACLRRFAKLFQRAGHQVPRDPRTILETNTEVVGDADFVHLGLIKRLTLKVNKGMQVSDEV